MVSREHRWEGALEHGGDAAELAPEHEPLATPRERGTDWVDDHDTDTRDIQPALGTRGGRARGSRPSRGRRSRWRARVRRR